MDCSPPGSSVHGILQGKSTGVGCRFLFQGFFPTQGSNLHHLHWQAVFTTEPPGKPAKWGAPWNWPGLETPTEPSGQNSSSETGSVSVPFPWSLGFRQEMLAILEPDSSLGPSASRSETPSHNRPTNFPSG